MLARAVSLSLNGIEAKLVNIEVDIVRGLPGFSIIGLPDSSIKESKERIRSAIENSAYSFPPKNFLVNLAPAGLKKQGANFDLSIAMAILSVTGQIDYDTSTIAMIGELSLDGSVKPVKGVISMVIALFKAGKRKVIVPSANRFEATILPQMSVYPVSKIGDVCKVFSGEMEPFMSDNFETESEIYGIDFAYVAGQESVKRAIEVAVAGHHNILLYGPPGSGKTMLSRCVQSIIPELTEEQAIETSMIHSVAGELKGEKGLLKQAVLRAPHHTASVTALVGGGRLPTVGEISLAHNGILFLDEFVEFKTGVLQALRQPLEDKIVTVARLSGTSTFPADFMLVAASNPCQCGYLFDREVDCSCSAHKVKSYFNKISGPILDRIDMDIYVPRVEYSELMGKADMESSAEIKKRVVKARQRQADRFCNLKVSYNSRMSVEDLKKFCQLDLETERFFQNSLKKLNLSARSLFKILKVARTVADLEESNSIRRSHLLEALSYKNLQRYYTL